MQNVYSEMEEIKTYGKDREIVEPDASKIIKWSQYAK